ncbi:MAG: aminomethyl-transferring glycine dehydrogenase subunit GcvPB [Candidatus Pacebacteria bacterium]|nr:aminomethyl-transferring glycine dehydrogenase subunit GcvPB [Candidatus Paceibacterota bacterium]
MFKSKKTIFEKSRAGISAQAFFDTDFEISAAKASSAHLFRAGSIGLPELTEVDVMRHYTSLSKEIYGVENGEYPLGSCTMKYNPKRNERYADLDGFRFVHPRQEAETASGLWELMYNLQAYISEITGMSAVSLAPAAGAHGEFTGLLMIRAHFASRREKRDIIIIPDSSHGTNPASAAMAGFTCRIIPTTSDGLFDLDTFEKSLDGRVAAIMMTNPSTRGLFEEQILAIAKKAHKNGSLLYYDGANLNALMGIVRPGDMGFDVVQLNLHKTFSTPHGGGGPGSGPVAVKRFLEPFLPIPVIIKKGKKYFPTTDRPQTIGRVKSFYGHITVLIKAYAYIRAMGSAGLKEASENAVLNANYIQHKLRKILPPVYNKICMHECLLSGEQLPTSAQNFAKRLIDYGIHPPTMVGAGCVYFPGGLKSAMLIEPTETESKENLDELVEIFDKVYRESVENVTKIDSAPYSQGVAKINLPKE